MKRLVMWFLIAIGLSGCAIIEEDPSVQITDISYTQDAEIPIQFYYDRKDLRDTATAQKSTLYTQYQVGAISGTDYTTAVTAINTQLTLDEQILYNTYMSGDVYGNVFLTFTASCSETSNMYVHFQITTKDGSVYDEKKLLQNVGPSGVTGTASFYTDQKELVGIVYSYTDFLP